MHSMAYRLVYYLVDEMLSHVAGRALLRDAGDPPRAAGHCGDLEAYLGWEPLHVPHL